RSSLHARSASDSVGSIDFVKSMRGRHNDGLPTASKTASLSETSRLLETAEETPGSATRDAPRNRRSDSQDVVLPRKQDPVRTSRNWCAPVSSPLSQLSEVGKVCSRFITVEGTPPAIRS